MNSSIKGGIAAPFVALGLLAVLTVGWGLWNRGLIPTIMPNTPSPSPSPLPTTPYYVQVRIGKHFDEDKNLVLEVPFVSDGNQHKVYEKVKGVKWLIDVKAKRVTSTGVCVGVQAKKTDTSHGEMPHQATLKAPFGSSPNTIDAPPVLAIDNTTGKEYPSERQWNVLVSSKPSQEAVVDSRYMH